MVTWDDKAIFIYAALAFLFVGLVGGVIGFLIGHGGW